jgi:hypothetical protein
MDPAHKFPPSPVWLKEAGPRVLTWWPAKAAGISLGMTGFFVAYFWLLRHPRHPPALMPHTVVDRLIGFHPWSLGFYLSLWCYVSLAPALLVVRRELVSYAVAAVGLGVAGLGIFYLWPTTVRWPDADWSQFPAFAFLGSAEATGNACPSLHVAFAVFTAIWVDRLLRQLGAGSGARLVNGFWCVGIMYSTIATREHVALDVLAGAALGVVAVTAHWAWLRRPPRSSCIQ